MSVTIEGSIVHEQSDFERIVHTCATRRVAQVTAATIALRAKGWIVSGISSSARPRLPLLLPGEKLGHLLDGELSDRRAQGFEASRDGAVLGVDACAGMPLRLFAHRGDVSEAIEICHWYLGA